jgi:hypothetical protein
VFKYASHPIGLDRFECINGGFGMNRREFLGVCGVAWLGHRVPWLRKKARMTIDVSGAWQVDATHVDVWFSGAAPASPDPAAFSVPGLVVSAVARQTDTTIVRLTTTAQAWNTKYTISVDASVATGTVRTWDYWACWIATGNSGGQTTHPFAQQAVVKGDYLFYCWLESDLKIRAQRMTISTGAFSSVWTSSDAVPSNDMHQFPSILIDQNDKVVVVHCPRFNGFSSYAARVCTASSEYDHATTPLDMGAWGEIGVSGNSGLDGASAAYSYFNPAMYADGTVLASLRSDTVTANPWHACVFKKTPAAAWTAGTMTVLAHNPSDADGDWTVLCYPQRPNITNVGGTEYAVMAILVTDASSDYRGMAVIYTPDKGSNWYSADGTLLTLPLTTSSTARAADPILWPYNGYVGGGSVADAVFTPDGDIYAAVETASGAAAQIPCGFKVYRFPAGGSAWESVDITDGTTYSGACPKFTVGPDHIFLVSGRQWSGEPIGSLMMDVICPSDSYPLDGVTSARIEQTTADGGYEFDSYAQVVHSGDIAYLLWSRTDVVAGALMMTTFSLPTEPVVPSSGWHRRVLPPRTWARRYATP